MQPFRVAYPPFGVGGEVSRSLLLGFSLSLSLSIYLSLSFSLSRSFSLSDSREDALDESESRQGERYSRASVQLEYDRATDITTHMPYDY